LNKLVAGLQETNNFRLQQW